MEKIEVPLNLATSGRLPQVSYKSGEPTRHLVTRKVSLPANLGDLAPLLVGAKRTRYVRVKIPMTPAEHREQKRGLFFGVTCMILGLAAPVPFVAFATSGDDPKPLLFVPAGILLVVFWALAAVLCAPLRGFRPTNHGTVKITAHPNFVAALRGGAPAAAWAPQGHPAAPAPYPAAYPGPAARPAPAAGPWPAAPQPYVPPLGGTGIAPRPKIES